MEVKEMSMEEVESRRAAISAEIETADKAGLEALNAELDALEERAAAIKAEAEARKAAAAEVVKGEGTVVKEQKEERKTMTEREIRNTDAYVDAYIKYVKTGKDTECRAALAGVYTENSGNGNMVPVPTFVEDYIRTAWENDQILSRCSKSYFKGNLKVGFEISGSDANWHEEGDPTAIPQETLTLGIMEIVPVSVKKWITVSDELIDMRGTAFLDYLYDEFTHKINKAIADKVVATILALPTTATDATPNAKQTTLSLPSTITLGAMGVSQLSDEATQPVVIINKQTYGTIKSLPTALSNFPVDPFDGLPVVFNNSLPALDNDTATGTAYAIVGDLRAVQLNFPNGEGISFKYDDLSLAEKDMVKIVGREYVGIGVTACDRFCVIKLGA